MIDPFRLSAEARSRLLDPSQCAFDDPGTEELEELDLIEYDEDYDPETGSEAWYWTLTEAGRALADSLRPRNPPT